MTDLGDLLATAEDRVERAHRGSGGPESMLDGVRRVVRRRRAARHVREVALGAVASLTVGALGWWGLGAAEVPTPPAATPTATPAPTTTRTSTTEEPATVQVADPVDGGAEALDAAGEGWSMVTSSQLRVGVPDTGVLDPEDSRETIALQAPDGTFTTLLELRSTSRAEIVAWDPGSPLAIAYAGTDAPFVAGVLDLRTGVLEQADLMWDNQPLGEAVTGDSLWVSNPEPERAADGSLVAGVLPFGFPGSRVAMELEPEAEEHVESFPEHTGTLLARSPDGAVRDLGEVTLPHYLHPLSPDRGWLALRGDDGGWIGLDVQEGESHDLPQWPTDEGCRPVGWVDDAQVGVTCPTGDGAWQLWAVDVARDAAPRALARSEVPLRDSWPLDDGRAVVGRVVLPSPCTATSDPAVLEDGRITSLTTGWSAGDHGGSLSVVRGQVVTSLNTCYVGGGSDPQRTVLVDPATGGTTTLARLDSTGAGQVVVDGDWRVTALDYVTNR